MGPAQNTITIQAGEKLAGTVKIDMDTFGVSEAKMEKAKLEGNKISFEINMQYGAVTYEGTVAGDEIKLNVTGTSGDKMTLIAKRQK